MTSDLFHRQRSCGALDDALHWLEQMEEPDIEQRVRALGQEHTCFATLQLIFAQCKKWSHKRLPDKVPGIFNFCFQTVAKYLVDLGTGFESTMRQLMAPPPDVYVKVRPPQDGNRNIIND